MIARAAKTDRGVVVGNSTCPIACTYNVFTGVVNWGCLADAVLQRVSRVADADWPNSAKCAPSMFTTVDICACIRRGNAVVAVATVAFVTDT